MKSKRRKADLGSSELLFLPDGRILAHNTPVMARVLTELNPTDEAMNRRALRQNTLKHEFPN
jgi:hypothetical protein